MKKRKEYESGVITRHAERRLKERSGIPKKAMDRNVKNALEKGIPHSQTKGRLNKWITSLYYANPRAGNIRLYAGKAYIFSENVLITVLEIPPNLKKDLPNMIKKQEDAPS